ncbi:MANSC domain-containing protein 1 [Elgaria multicarinata webbii]|uniref:MANSC domain-containing protein 1 n=1 Tax=Elgaria multicarinata webbii TaxID=159646 RepID=UPI002FCD3B29
MSARIARCFVHILVFCAVLKPSQSQHCSPEKMENIAIDIKAALSKGIRGTDPIHTSSSEACANVCCFGGEIADNKMCNYVIFNAKAKDNYPNCYLFHYPINETCPVKQALGLVTYRIIKDTAFPQLTPSSIKPSHPIVNGNLVTPQAGIFDPHSPTKHPHGLGPSQKPTASEKMGILGYIGKHFDKISGHSKDPKKESGNSSESTDSSPMHESSSSLLPNITNAIQHFPIIQPTVKLPIVTAGTQAGTAAALISPISPSNATATKSTRAYHENMPPATVNPRSTTVPQPSTTSGTSASNLSSLSSSLSTHISSSLHDAYFSNGKEGSEGNILDGVPGAKGAPHFGDKSILLAALLFGVMFFVLVTVVVSRKMHDALQQRRYTRLDYLINGMYANM